MNKNLKIYISGPMTGRLEQNYPAFIEAEWILKQNGFKNIVNPAKLGVQDSWEEYMKQDIKLLCDCDGVATLDGWGDSKGARVEVQLALTLGLQVKTLATWLGFPTMDLNFPRHIMGEPV